MCSPATRGIWMDFICCMHDANVGQLIGTPEQLCRIARCNVAEVKLAIDELGQTQAAEIHIREGTYTVVCRRLKRKQEISKLRSESGSKGAANRKQSERRPEYEDESEVLKAIEEFCSLNSIPGEDAVALFHKWQGNGSTNGGQPIRDWKATILSWQRHGYLPSQKQGKNGSNVQYPQWEKMNWPRDWQEAQRQVRFLKTQTEKYPQANDRITAIQAQFNLK